MSKRSEKLIVTDVATNIKSILEFTKGMNYEATKQLPESFLNDHPEIEWQKMIAFRNILIHEYFRVERKIQWNIIKNILPDLKSRLVTLRASLE